MMQIDAIHLCCHAPSKNTAIAPPKPAYRLSVSLTPEQHRQLNEIARKNRVSAAWVVQEAVERLLQQNQPLVQVNPT